MFENTPKRQNLVSVHGLPSAQPGIFQGRGDFAELEHFNKISLKTQEKRLRRNIFGILNRKFYPKKDTIRIFFFNFQKKAGEASTPTP